MGYQNERQDTVCNFVDLSLPPGAPFKEVMAILGPEIPPKSNAAKANFSGKLLMTVK